MSQDKQSRIGKNEKNYPDIHSLVLMSTLFHVSLDTLIKGDLEMMKEELKTEDIQKFNEEGKIFAILFIVSVIAFVPLYLYLKVVGLIIWGILYAVTLYFAHRVEKQKKQYNVQTYREIIAFSEGKKLDEIEKIREEGKRPYQRIFLVFGSMIFAVVVMCIMIKILL